MEAMIDPKEIRIGNLVDVNGIPMQITQSDFVDKPFLRKANPIPLTEEWLIRAGFEDKELDYRIYYTNILGNEQAFRVDYSPYAKIYPIDLFEYEDDECAIVNLCEIQYVHQLQNLFFALVGRDLEFKEL